MNQIQEFYNQHHFPNKYNLNQLKKYNINDNKYVAFVDQYLTNGQNVLDVGCGTGLLTNLFALKYSSQYTGIDFSTAADYADNFAKSNNINNVKFVKQDFLQYKASSTYDIIFAVSFLNHVPEFKLAIEKIKGLLTPNGYVIVGIYNPIGNFIKKVTKINYNNDRLELDQESNPYEISFSHNQMLNMWEEYKLDKVMPSMNNKFVGLSNLFNARNGGLTMYAFKDKNYEH